MITRNKISFTVAFLFILTRVLTSSIYAVELVISDNGSGSSNQIQVQSDALVEIEQTNEADVTNSVGTNANTGNNEISGSQGEVVIDTGDISANVLIDNSLNDSVVTTQCCQSEGSAEITGNGTGSKNSGHPPGIFWPRTLSSPMEFTGPSCLRQPALRYTMG